MVEYTCNRCLKNYNNKCDYNRHLNRKRPCKIIKINESIIKPINSITDKQKNANLHKKMRNLHKNPQNLHKNRSKKYKCSYCEKNYSRKDSLKRHILSYCKVKKEKDAEIEKLKNKNKIIENNNMDQ